MDSNLWYGGTKARDFWSIPGIASVFNLRRGLCSKVPPSPIEMRPAEWSGAAVKVPASSGPAAFPLRDAPVARFCR